MRTERSKMGEARRSGDDGARAYAGGLARAGRRWRCLLGAAALAGCAPAGADFGEELPGDGQRPFTSEHATLLDLDFAAEAVAPWSTPPSKAIDEQLLFTVGQLNAFHSVARLDRAAVSQVKLTANGDGLARIRYRVRVPVGWGEPLLPDALELVLPRRITASALAGLEATHGGACSDADAATVTPGNFWYHYRPLAPSCALAEPDIVRATASVTVSVDNTLSAFPEHHLVWADNTLRVVAVFGKYEDGASDPGDAGIEAYHRFLADLPGSLGLDLESDPPDLGDPPGAGAAEVSFRGRTADGRALEVTALLIDSPKLANKAFDARYAALSADADLLVYDGHAGLGANVRALAEKGTITPGKWQLVFINGCDTFAYLDDRLAQRRAAANPGDPTGTRHLDVMTNLMPAYFASMPSATLAVIVGLLDPSRTYRDVLSDIDDAQVVVVTGEEDNAYHSTSPPPWPGLSASGAVARGDEDRFETPLLPAGEYRVALGAPAKAAPGDADLYIGLGFPPTADAFSYAPYLSTTSETVELTLAEPTRLYILVRGYEGSESPACSYDLAAAAR
ncbi:MAG: hypothetical protein WKG00_08640 [Polyangiaceae bacterium]